MPVWDGVAGCGACYNITPTGDCFTGMKNEGEMERGGEEERGGV